MLMTLANNAHFNSITNVIRAIVESRLSKKEKMLLVIEWILRDYNVYDLFEMNPEELKDVVKLRLKTFFTDQYIKSTLGATKKAIDLPKDKNTFNFYIAFAYFLYIDDEFVFDVATRKLLLSKEKSFGFSIQEIQALMRTWTEKFSDPATLFMRHFSNRLF